MGVELCIYRARVGLFHMPKVKSKSEPSLWLSPVIFVRPSTCVLFSLALILLCSGDVERNPGPDGVTDDGQISNLQKSIETLIAANSKYQSENSSRLDNIALGISEIRTRVTALEASIQDLTQVRDDVNQLKTEVENIKAELNFSRSVSANNMELVEIVDDLNNRSRRNNLIIKGLSETENETHSQLESRVKDFFSEVLGVQVGILERIHRLGYSRPNYSRPVIIKLLDYRDRVAILKNAPKLKHHGPDKIWIDEDFSPRTRLARSKLWAFGKELRSQNIKTRLRIDKLYSDKKIFAYDFVEGRVVEVNSNEVRTD